MIIHLFNSSSLSGPERLVLPALARLKDRVTVINLREERIGRLRDIDPLEDFARTLQLDYLDVRVCGHWDYVAIRDLRLLLDRLDPDLVHAHDVKASAYLLQARQGWSRDRFPIVSTHHGVHGRPDLKTRLYEWIYRRYLLTSFHRVFCVSSADYTFLNRSGLRGDRLRLHLNGIDGTPTLAAQRPEAARAIRARWLPHEEGRDSMFLMGVIGRLSAEKNHRRLFAVLEALHQIPCHPNWKCLVFGTGPLEKELQDEVQSRGLSERVVWMGYRDHVGGELAGLDLVLSFSKAEGLPINLIEAGWAGTPVMATLVGGVQDLVPDSRFGVGVSLQESSQQTALRLQACMTPEGRTSLREQARCFQERVMAEFTQTKWLERLKVLYAELNVDLATPPIKMTVRSRAPVPESGRFSHKLQSTLLTRLLLYPTGRLDDLRDWNRNGFRILMYHRFSQPLATLQETLARQCAYMKRYYHIVSLTEIAQSLEMRRPLPPNALAVTVDDGYRDFKLCAAPVFAAFQIPVTVYLVSEFIEGKVWLWWDQIRYAIDHSRKPFFEMSFGPDQPPVRYPIKTADERRYAMWALTETLKKVSNAERLSLLKKLPEALEVTIPLFPPAQDAPMDWQEIRALTSSGVDFGAHTKTHPILSRIQDVQEMRDEITQSKERIEQATERPVQHFGYPNGCREDVNEQAFRVLKSSRFLTAVTAEKGVNFQGAHPYWLRRIGVDATMSKYNFQALLAGLGGGRSKAVPLSLASSS